jgi:inhibitor of cysteine peptidase
VKVRLVVIVAVLVSTIALGCSSGREATKSIQVSIDDVLNQSAITRDVTLKVGDTLKVALGSNHTTPYRWTPDPKLSDPTVLKQTSHEFVEAHHERGVTGTPGTEVWMYTATKGGTTTIVAQYAGIGGTNTAPTCTFTATVTVQ